MKLNRQPVKENKNGFVVHNYKPLTNMLITILFISVAAGQGCCSETHTTFMPITPEGHVTLLINVQCQTEHIEY